MNLVAEIRKCRVYLGKGQRGRNKEESGSK